jgi:isochorismate hydrolase
MNLIDSRRCALVLVDYQGRLMPMIHNGAQAVAHALRLADIAHEMGIPVIGTEQNPKGLGPNADAVRQRCGTTLSKMHFDACADGLLDLLRLPGEPPADAPAGASVDAPAQEVVIAGCEAHVCLMQTALGLLRAGLTVWVVVQACGSRTAENHTLGMERLRAAGATLVSVEMVAFEWLRSCEHAAFRRVLKLLKEPLGA